jgi:hypothetical protein
MLCYPRQRKKTLMSQRPHCFLHREVLVSKTVGEDLKQVLVAVNMVSFIKQRPLKSRMFATLSENMQKDHVTLLQNTKVR